MIVITARMVAVYFARGNREQQKVASTNTSQTQPIATAISCQFLFARSNGCFLARIVALHAHVIGLEQEADGVQAKVVVVEERKEV